MSRIESGASDQTQATLPEVPETGPLCEPPDQGEPALSAEVTNKLEALWEEFDAAKEPTPAKMDVLLEGFLGLPPAKGPLGDGREPNLIW